MRKITAGLFIAADGVVEAPDQWHFPYYNDEMGAAVNAQLGSADTLLFGRATYEGFAGAWPSRESGPVDAGDAAAAVAEVSQLSRMAKALGDARKLVVSHSPLTFTWRNSEQLRGDLVEAVTELKSGPGGAIAMSGSVSVVRQLLAARLLDELHLFVHPIAVGHGQRLFADSATPLPLKLLSCEAFRTGVLHVVYGPAEEA
ncbi:dihydrofolate reductase family protein [Kitasatospora sp. NPDC048722]|uniref:dihydrofolate reductase family protein n=1 Tax=Kitasatospora sp. NPDC048722 TaxID=3155639 RepID=UPI00340B044E